MNKYDVTIVGGGTAGCACAYIAGKLGLKVLLIEKNSFLGGSITSALVVPAMKTSDNAINTEFFDALYNKLHSIGGAITYSDGNKIAIKHADNSVGYYMHLSSRGVGVGQQVTGGQVIGRVGSTGRSTGPHLHLGFKNAQGQWINPKSKTMIATPKLQAERLARLQSQVKRIREDVLKTEAETPREFEGSSVKVKQRKI